MVFSSIIFLCIFLPVMIIGYYVLPKKLKNVFLLIGSLFFYAFGEPKYIFLMLASIIGNYIFGIIIHYSEVKGKIPVKKLTLFLTVAFNIGLLIYFKYFVLIVTTIKDLFDSNITVPEIALPIGISFFTFQGMSYVIDVYRQDNKLKEDGTRYELVQKNPINLALYISMFPQLIAGPIVRYGDIKDYLKDRTVDSGKFVSGIERFIIGLAKKVILANSLGEVADKIFSSDFSYMGTFVSWIGIVFFTIQIYFDFSGYSDMAIGLGRMFGFEFMENFNYPYISRSITEHWRRWHISLSTWFKDYVYIPLGGNRRGNVYVNLFIVFLATGIWHGAAWGYLIWGMWHGMFELLEKFLKSKFPKVKVPPFIGWAYTMLVIIVGFVVFKLEEITPALSYLSVMFGISRPEYTAFSPAFYLDNKVIFIFIVSVLACIPWKQYYSEFAKANSDNAVVKAVAACPEIAVETVKRVALLVLLAVCFMFIVNSTYNPFIYFRF
ncbi:MAG: MBOAT family O-acyltransferase [Lachnospiraceae bacterium]|nr:MBOAT family O-acyltransferase [Lachnospiraceae bacterium]